MYMGKDIMGSVRSVTADTGTLEGRYEYDAFGQPYKGDLAGGMNLGYAGKPYDTATGLYNYGYRDYKPQAARFTTVDPIRDGNNWFAYVNNDPVNWMDLWGLDTVDAKQEIKVADTKTHYAKEGFSVLGVYSKTTNILDLYIIASDSSHWSSKIESFNASGHVLERSQSGPVLGTTPVGHNYGQPSQYYIPQELPNGNYELGSPVYYNENDKKYNSLGPVFIPIKTTQEVPVYGTEKPKRNSDTGLYEPIGTQSDGGYGIHADMAGSNTTWGCVGLTGTEKTKNATTLANWVQAAQKNNGSATLIIWD